MNGASRYACCLPRPAGSPSSGHEWPLAARRIRSIMTPPPATPVAGPALCSYVTDMFSLFEKTLTPTGRPERPEPPGGLIAFYWHFARQAQGLFIALFVIELVVALLDTAVPWFIGRIVTLVTSVPA